jgi:quinol-cytochrome oxidoreductase complex cytochrome b subunit
MSDTTVDRPTAQPHAPRRQGLWDALDERLGLKGLQYPVPAHANTLAYSLGGLSLITFVLMVATGIFLTQYYDPARTPRTTASATSSPALPSAASSAPSTTGARWR